MSWIVPYLPWLLNAAHVLVVLIIALRVIMHRPPTGVALAWLLVVVSFPLGGALLYLLFGERRVGAIRARRIARVRARLLGLRQRAVDRGLTAIPWQGLGPEAREMDRLSTTMNGIPAVTGGAGQLFDDTHEILRRLAEDIDGAQHSVLMEFYIWNPGGDADGVLEALIRAAQRGVNCRVLVDALGARPWWKSDQPQRLRAAGVALRPALPTGLHRTVVGRNDLRLHRKIVVIDAAVAWTGSMNLVDPRYFKQEAHVGEWVDAMIRLEGAVVAPLALTVVTDWVTETDEDFDSVVRSCGLHQVRAIGKGAVQVVSSGPAETGDGLLQMVLALVASANDELVLTTPYFVPDESLLRALRGAAGRGVKVSLILPRKVDSVLTRYASRSYYDELAELGIGIFLFDGGLLHTKSITVDRRRAMFGTVNLDMRSLWLNYEVALFIYGGDLAAEIRDLQARYLEDSVPLTATDWPRRGQGVRLLENSARLISPLL